MALSVATLTIKSKKPKEKLNEATRFYEEEPRKQQYGIIIDGQQPMELTTQKENLLSYVMYFLNFICISW